MKGDKFKPYTRIGIAAGLGTPFERESFSEDYVLWFDYLVGNPKVKTWNYEESYKLTDGKLLSLGGKAVIGSDYEISRVLSLFGELNYTVSRMALIDEWAAPLNNSSLGLQRGAKFTPK